MWWRYYWPIKRTYFYLNYQKLYSFFSTYDDKISCPPAFGALEHLLVLYPTGRKRLIMKMRISGVFSGERPKKLICDLQLICHKSLYNKKQSNRESLQQESWAYFLMIFYSFIGSARRFDRLRTSPTIIVDNWAELNIAHLAQIICNSAQLKLQKIRKWLKNSVKRIFIALSLI